MAKSKWIDVTFPVRSGMVHWPDNPEIRVEKMLDMEKGAICNVSTLSLGAHTGTHMDGLLHFINRGKPLDQMPVDVGMGPARVIEIRDKVSIKVDHLHSYRIKAGERIIFKTLNTKKSWKSDRFDDNFVYISQEAAGYLAERRIQMVGIDYLSVGGYYKDGVETHLALLGNGIWIVEGLDLSRIKPGKYDLICLPMKVLNSDGAPARALLRPR
jgi:arylformamidase